MQAPPASLSAIRILEGGEETEIGAADSGKPTLSFWEDAAMKYTIELNDWEAIAPATLMKKEFQNNIDFLEKNQKACEVAPELSSFTEYTMKEQVL